MNQSEIAAMDGPLDFGAGWPAKPQAAISGFPIHPSSFIIHLLFRLQFDVAVFIEDERGEFAVFFLDLETVEPELFVLGVGEPTAGGLLHVFDDGAGGLVDPGAVEHAVTDLLGHDDFCAGDEAGADGIVHEGIVWERHGGTKARRHEVGEEGRRR